MRGGDPSHAHQRASLTRGALASVQARKPGEDPGGKVTMASYLVAAHGRVALVEVDTHANQCTVKIPAKLRMGGATHFFVGGVGEKSKKAAASWAAQHGTSYASVAGAKKALRATGATFGRDGKVETDEDF